MMFGGCIYLLGKVCVGSSGPVAFAIRFVHQKLRDVRFSIVKCKLTYHMLWPAQSPTFTNTLHPSNGLFSSTTWLSWYQKGKTSLDLNEARGDGVSGCSGISWTICKQSAPRSRQRTTPTPHHSILQVECSSWCPTNSVKAPQAKALAQKMSSSLLHVKACCVFRWCMYSLLLITVDKIWMQDNGYITIHCVPKSEPPKHFATATANLHWWNFTHTRRHLFLSSTSNFIRIPYSVYEMFNSFKLLSQISVTDTTYFLLTSSVVTGVTSVRVDKQTTCYQKRIEF